jgi:hypothetical protein
MGLSIADTSKVPSFFTIEDCYDRIYKWHKTNGKQERINKFGNQNIYIKDYENLVDKMPAISNATDADQDYIFYQMVCGLLEWSYHIEDEFGIKIAAYTHCALEIRYPNWGFHNEAFQQNIKNSFLHIIK